MSNAARTGDWIQTASGGRFWPLDPLPEDVLIEDIAHALSLICRFGGHCREFYSVAQHSVLVSRLCPNFPLHGLLHDAAEAYLGDLPRPTKRGFREAGITAYDYAEQAIMGVVSARFWLSWTGGAAEEVKAADEVMLATEAVTLMRPLDQGWRTDFSKALPDGVIPWPCYTAEASFLASYRLLCSSQENPPEAGFLGRVSDMMNESES